MTRRRRRSRFAKRIGHWLETFSLRATEWAGSSFAFGTAAGVIVLWIASGPIFGFSDTWQLAINTGTTIVTFLMVFLIQRAQNKESRIVQLKLSEIVAALPGANNQLIDVDDLSEAELATLHRHFHALARMAEQDADIHQSHSIDEAERRHEAKSAKRRQAGGRTSN